MQPTNRQPNQGWENGHRLIPAVIVIGIGVLFLLNNLNILYFSEWARYWPVILIAIGLVKLVDADSPGGHVAGGVLVGVGAILLGQTLGYLNVQMHDLWPLFLIGAGLLMLFRGDSWHGISRGPRIHAYGRVREASVFGGGKRQINTQDFTGGHIDAVFSGYEIDLRGAIMTGDSATLKVSAVFSGVEIRIPETWSAVVEGTGVFGAFADNTVQPNPQTPGLKRLFVKGDAVFGGVDVKN
jgi:multisubunit Na+/H+ antiporter MnhB subunit